MIETFLACLIACVVSHAVPEPIYDWLKAKVRGWFLGN